MKKTTILITALIMLFVGAPQAKAVPMYYTFEGTVTGLIDGAGFIDDQFGASFGAGSLVTYTVIVDFAADGTYRTNGGTTYTRPDIGGVDYFYTDAYSGDYLLSTDGGRSNEDWDIAEYNYGYDYVGGSYGFLLVNSEDELMRIYSVSSNFSTWAVGASGLTGMNYAYSVSRASSRIHSSLKLISIVPEPSILLLLGSGLLALGMFRRVRQEG